MITPYTKKAHQRYYVNGKRVSGASTIAKIGRDNTQLMDWAYQCGLDGLDKDEELQSSGRIGTIAHAVLQAHVLEDELDLTGFSQPDIEIGEELGDKLCYKWDRSGLALVACERQLTSKLGYGGTLDLVGRRIIHPSEHGQRMVLIDAKTSKNVWASHAFQVAGGYRGLWNEHEPDDMIDEVEIWCFSKQGKAHVMEISGEALDMAWTVFERQLSLLNALKAWDKKK